MTLQQIEYLVALDTHRNFVKAAQACNVTQPTLSMQIKKLEEEWGVLIFERGNGPLKPTAMGIEILIKGKRLLAEKNALETSLSTAKASLEGNLHLGVIPTVSPYLLPRFLHPFAEAHPNLQLLVTEMHSEEIISQLKSGDLDVGLLALPIEDDEIEEMALFLEPFWLCISADFKDLDLESNDLGFVNRSGPLVLAGGHCLREQVLQFCSVQEKKEAKVLYEGGSLETLIRLVGQSGGYTLVPELAIPEFLPAAVEMRAFPSPAPSREIGLIVHKRFVRRLLIERLGNSICNAIPDKLLKHKGMRLKWRK